MIKLAPLHCAFIFEHLPINPVFNFTDNVAGDGGDAIYGAMFNKNCITPSGITHTSDYYPSVLNNISLFSPSFLDDLSSVISSDPLQLCFCEDGRPDCSFTLIILYILVNSLMYLLSYSVICKDWSILLCKPPFSFSIIHLLN